MPKLTWIEQHKPYNESRCTFRSLKRFCGFVFCGTTGTRRVKRRSLRILEEEFYSDDFNNETLELMYTSMISVIENMQKFKKFWKNEMTYNEKDIREFAKNFCFSSNVDIIDKMTEYFERMAISMIKLYNRRYFTLIVNVKLPEDHKSKLSLCIQLIGPKERGKSKVYNYTTSKTADGWGEIFFFDLGHNIANHTALVHFFDETEQPYVNWFSTVYPTQKQLLTGQVPLKFDINDIKYIVIGEKTFEYETSMKSESETKHFYHRTRLMSVVNTKVSVNNYHIHVSSNLKPTRMQKVTEQDVKNASNRDYLFVGNLKGYHPVERKIATVMNSYDLRVKINFYLGINISKPQRSNNLRMLTLYYRLMIIKKAKCELLTRDTQKVYNLQFLFWNDMIDVKEDKMFNYILKSHCIQHNITAGEDYACRCMAVFASMKYKNILFGPNFIADCLIQLLNHKEQLEFLPIAIPTALNTAFNGLLNYIISNYLRNINFILEKDVMKAEQNIKDDQQEVKPVKSSKLPNRRNEEFTIQTSLHRLRHFSQKQKAIISSLDAEVNQQLLQSLICVNTLLNLSEYKRDVKSLFERHLQQSVIRWFKEFMRLEKPQINDFFEKFLDELLVGDKYFQKAQLYSKYSYILTSAIVITVEQAKRIIDSYTKLSTMKSNVVFDSDYIKDLFLHLIRLSNYIEKSYTKLEAIELHNLKNEIKEYLPSAIAMLFMKDTQSVIDCMKHDENFAPMDVSQNILHCKSSKRLTHKIEEVINMGLEDLRLPPHLFGEELTKNIVCRCNSYCDAIWKRVELEKFYVNPLKQGVGPEAFVVINTFQMLSSFLVSERCGQKFTKAFGSGHEGKSVESQYEVLSMKTYNTAKKLWKIIVDCIMGMLSQVLLFIFCGLECEGYKPSTVSNTVSMLMFQAKHRIEDAKFCEELLIDTWSQFLQLFERNLSSFRERNTVTSKDGLNRMRNVLNDTVASVLLNGINSDIVNFQSSLENLKSHFNALIVNSKLKK